MSTTTTTASSTNPFTSTSTTPPSSLSSTGCRPFSAIRDCDCDRRPHTAKLVLRKQDTVLDLSTLRTLKFPKEFRSSPHHPILTPHSFSLLFEPFASTGYAMVSVTSHQPCADAHFPSFHIEVHVRTDSQHTPTVGKRILHRFASDQPTVVIDRLRSPVEMFEDFDAGRTVTITVSIKRTSTSVESVMERVVKRVGEFRRQDELTDVVLRSKDAETISAHRVILASRSEYFESMFCRDLSESTLSTIDFPDESHTTLSTLVDYLYTHTLPSHLDTYADLYIAADKYRMVELMHMIRDRLAVMPIPALVGMVKLACSGHGWSGNNGNGSSNHEDELEAHVLSVVRERLVELKQSEAMKTLFLDEKCHSLLIQLF